MTPKHLYSEIHTRRYGTPTFPDVCPCCGAVATQKEDKKVHYACGGSYTPKPQIQNHTDKWWGQCPVTKKG